MVKVIESVCIDDLRLVGKSRLKLKSKTLDALKIAIDLKSIYLPPIGRNRRIETTEIRIACAPTKIIEERDHFTRVKGWFSFVSR